MSSQSSKTYCHETTCPLYSQTFVPGEGPAKAYAVVLGEGPGVEEARKGRPFVGPSGQLLDAALKRIGVARSELYITNVVKCFGAKEAAARLCARTLQAEVALREPKIIVPMGNVATDAVLGPGGGIMSRRGLSVFSKAYNCWVVPTLHPAAVLRRPETYPEFQKDLKKALVTSYIRELGPRPFTYQVVDDVTSALVVLGKARQQPEVVFDLETSGYDRFQDDILCMTLCWDPDQSYVLTQRILEHPAVQQELRALMLEPHRVWVGHSGKFDCAFLEGRYGFRPTLGYDTLLASYVLDERRGHDLKLISRYELDAPDWEGDLARYLRRPKKDSFALLPKDVLHRYCAHDGVYTWRLFNILRERVEREPRLSRLLHELLIPASDLLVEIENQGLLVDTDYLEELRVSYTQEVEELQAKLRKLSGHPYLNPRSAQQMARVLFDELQLPQLQGRSTKAEVLEQIAYLHKIPMTLKEYRHAAKMLSTYVKSLEEELDINSRAHSSFLLHGTVTGRLSSRDPDFHNQPRGPRIRNLFIASPGYSLLYLDYSQMELRVLAVLAKDDYMIQCYHDGRDLHAETVKLFWGPDADTEDEEIRMIAKAVNFGIPYGRTPQGMARDANLQVTAKEAAAYISQIFRQRPGVAAYVKECERQAYEDGVLETVFGRRRRFPLITAANVADVRGQARNFPIQSTASDCKLLTLLRLKEALPSEAHLLLEVHDSILLECPTYMVDDVARVAKQVMESVPVERVGSAVPWVVDVKVGYRWGSLEKWEGG